MLLPAVICDLSIGSIPFPKRDQISTPLLPDCIPTLERTALYEIARTIGALP